MLNVLFCIAGCVQCGYQSESLDTLQAGRVAQMVEHQSNKLRVQGSIPCMTTSRLAQMVERKTLNLVVEGSIPSVGVLVPVSLVGQDIRLSPERPGFKSRAGNFWHTPLTLRQLAVS